MEMGKWGSGKKYVGETRSAATAPTGGRAFSRSIFIHMPPRRDVDIGWKFFSKCIYIWGAWQQIPMRIRMQIPSRQQRRQ